MTSAVAVGEGGEPVRRVDVEEVADVVRALCIEANHSPRADHLAALRRALASERSPIGCQVLRDLLRNVDAAREHGIPLCQDTGYTIVRLRVGQDVHLVGGDVTAAVNRGVATAQREGLLRASLVRDPVHRINSGDNTPAIIDVELVPGSGVHVNLIAKGAGCDNMSAVRMLTPADGTDAVVDFAVRTVERAGPSASPPVTIGIGLGGTFARAPTLATLALMRTSGEPSLEPHLAALEERVLDAVNATGIGPAGFGGTVTALAVHVEAMATHIAALPVAIAIDCHTHRVRTREL